ncbi:MAG: nucleotidyltransferase [Sandaracinus sp.]|nr:nucleotidyltransferase [Sandaracinus sp.]|tara:strand:+ start:3413 stop:4222 length:810 start_codon:yes stop_codon:yes gene_type:complete
MKRDSTVVPVPRRADVRAFPASRALILAAGKGSRLVQGRPYPKPLETVAGVPMIVRVIRGLKAAGVREVGVVIGHLGDVLRTELDSWDLGVTISYFENDEVDKPNGTSVLKAAEFVTGPTFLLMSDHLWNPELVRRVGEYPLAVDESVLGVDFDIPRCFDLPDATKVRIDGDEIVEISKELPAYDCLDTGVFRITPALIEALRAADGPEGCSLSQGVGALAADGRMKVVDVGTARWIDVDTPDAREEAERLIAAYGETLAPAERTVAVG